MTDNIERELGILKTQHDALLKSHRALLKVLCSLADGARSFAQTEREVKSRGEEVRSTRLKVHYETFNKAYLEISKLKFNI